MLFWKGLNMEGLIFEVLRCVFPASAKNTSETTLPTDKTDGIIPIPIRRGLNS